MLVLGCRRAGPLRPKKVFEPDLGARHQDESQNEFIDSVPRMNALRMRWWVWRGSVRVPGSPSGVPGSGRRVGEEVVEAGAGDQQQPVGGAGAGHGEAAEGGVELVELVGAGERVDRDGDRVGLALPGVDGGGDEDAVGQVVLGRPAGRPCSVASSTAWLRVARTTISGSSSGADRRDAQACAFGRARVRRSVR